MFKNKHVIIAMIVAPILSVLAWIGVGQIGGEKPQPAVPGESYPLVEKSNCRYASGICDMENETFRLRLTLHDGIEGPEFLLSASHALDGVLLGISAAGEEVAPQNMQADDRESLQWRIAVADVPQPEERIRLVALAAGSRYFADASTTFLQVQENKIPH